jgi:hypothetical protein
MNEPATSSRKENRRMLLWFLIALLIALMPWFLLAQDQNKAGSKVGKAPQVQEVKGCKRVCSLI